MSPFSTFCQGKPFIHSNSPTVQASRQRLNMNLTVVYAGIVGGLLLSFTARGVANLLHAVLQSRALTTWLYDHMYPYFINRHGSVRPVTRLGALVQAVYWIATLAFNLVGVHRLAQALSRSGSLALIHLIPLFLGNYTETAAHVFDLPYALLGTVHRSLGVMAVTQSVAHVILACMDGNVHSWNFRGQTLFYGAMVGAQSSNCVLLISDKGRLRQHLRRCHSLHCLFQGSTCTRCF